MRERGWNHEHLDVNDIRIHYVRHGAGFPLVLLHGWPEFWYIFRKNVPPSLGRVRCRGAGPAGIW